VVDTLAAALFRLALASKGRSVALSEDQGRRSFSFLVASAQLDHEGCEVVDHLSVSPLSQKINGRRAYGCFPSTSGLDWSSNVELDASPSPVVAMKRTGDDLHPPLLQIFGRQDSFK